MSDSVFLRYDVGWHRVSSKLEEKIKDMNEKKIDEIVPPQQINRLKLVLRTEEFGAEEVELWPEAVNGAELLDELEALLRRYVVLPKWAGETVALWILHTYAFHCARMA